MDRAARRARSHETLASAAEPSPGARRRAASAAAASAAARVSPAASSASVHLPSDPVIVLDDDADADACPASSRRHRSVGSVATRTRSRKLGLWRHAAAESAGRRRAAAAAESGGGSEGTVEGSVSSRSGSNEERLGSSWGTSESVAGDLGEGKEEEEVEVVQVDGEEEGIGEANERIAEEDEENCGADVDAGENGAAMDADDWRDVDGIEDHCGNGEDRVVDVNEEPCGDNDDDYDDEIVEEELVGDVIRAYGNGVMDVDDREGFSDLDANWEAEDEMEVAEDAEEDGETQREAIPVDDHAKVEMEAMEDHEASGGVVHCEKEEFLREERVRDALHAEIIGKSEEAQEFTQGNLQIEICDSDEEVKVLNDDNDGGKGRALVQAKIPIVASCVAWRTRSSWGIKRDRLSYSTYFEALSDEPKEEEDDDTEVELDDDDDDDDDDDGDGDGGDDEEEEEEEEAERKHRSNGIDTSDDERTDAMVRYGLECEDDEDPDVEIIEPLNFEKDGSEGPVGNDMIAAQQKRSRFTWELERKKKLKLGMMKRRRLYERDLESESGSSDSGRMRSCGLRGRGGGRGNKAFAGHKIGKKKKDQSSKAGKKSSRAAMLKRQSLLKLLIDTMCGDKDKESSPLGQSQQIEYNVKDLHPLIFSFGDEDPISVERSEHEVALNILWADFDFALESENIGTYHDDEGQAEQSNELDLALTPMTLCSRGKHQFIIDEQIGIRCKCCSLVNLEIRFILPSLVSSFGEKPAWRNASSVKSALMYDDLCERAESDDEHSYNGHLYGTVWDLIPGVITTMYQHQREAFEFMWNNLVGGIRLDELKDGAKPDVVGGCVICHAPGTGKTRLAIVFIQTYMKVFPECRPVIIAPRGMLFAWEEEFKKWDVNVPFHIMNTAEYSGKEDRDICKLIKKEHRTEKLTRLVKLLSWNKGHGILGISYGLYKKLTSDKSESSEDNKVRSILLEKPGLLVLDEGHTPRNERSVIWKTLGKVKTEKRIILSGTPFQNNFLELYNILCLVRPKFGEMFLTKTKVGRRHFISKKERDMFSDKYEKGVWASLTSHVTDDNADKVRSILKPFVHIHNGNILRTLPGLRECVIVLKPLPLQKSIIKKVENIGSGNNFEHEYIISLASIHPSLVTSINMSDEEASLIDKPLLEKLRSDPYEGVKTRFVVEVVRLCEALKEKVLIFSQFIQPLALIKEHLRKFFKWREGKEILQMDGKILPRYRQASIDAFNDPESDARVLLASTRACCEGISLTGASRVVLLDVVWNPAVGRQAISRAFRIGQRKYVYTYNLITYGTGEGDKYDRQAEKDHLSKLVFSTEDEYNNVRNMLSRTEVEHCSKLISEDKVLEEMTSHDQLKGMFLKIYYPPTESNIVYTYNQIASALS